MSSISKQIFTPNLLNSSTSYNRLKVKKLVCKECFEWKYKNNKYDKYMYLFEGWF